MNACLRLHYQRQLIYAGLDDFTPNGVLSTYMGGRDGHNVIEWKREVATFVDLGIQCGLIKATNWKRLFSFSMPVNIGPFLLGDGSSQRFQLDNDVVWNALYFFGTEDLIGDLEKFDLRNWDALMFLENRYFLRFIQDKYRLVFFDVE